MRLTLYTDYALRVLMYLAADADGLATIDEIAKGFWKCSGQEDNGADLSL